MIWDPGTHQQELEFEGRHGSCFDPNHVYAPRASQKDRENRDVLFISVCPSYRVTAGFGRNYPQPIYDYTAAKQHLSSVAGTILHGRILLRSLAENTLEEPQFPLEDCCYRVCFLTCCGKMTRIHVIRPRDIWTSNKTHYHGQSIGYHVIAIAALDMTDMADCDRLKSWLNAIHELGITLHYDSVLKDGFAATLRQRQVEHTLDLSNLRHRAFTYGKVPKVIKFGP